MKDLLLKLPKSELHLHIRGGMPVDVFTGLLNKYSGESIENRASEGNMRWFMEHDNIRPYLTPRTWAPEEVAPIFSFETFDQFLATFCFTGYFIRDASDMRDLISGVLESLKAQNVVYAEITVSVKEYLRQGISLPELAECLDEGAAHPDIRVQWIADLVRDFGAETCFDLLTDLIAQDCRSLVGITLGGAEHRFPPELFERVYATARDAGLHRTIHAGEALGPQSVWNALKLGVERTGHGVRSIEDPDLVRYLAERRIPLEVCPTSNLRTGIYPSYTAHPLKALYEAGVPVTINSDDPTFFGTTLLDEYMHTHESGIGQEDLFQMIRNGFRYAFLPQAQIDVYLEQLDRAWAAQGKRSN